MDLQASLELALVNLTSPPVLAFVLGLIAVAVRADLRLPDAVYQATSMYLLLAIGIKGGVALREASPGEIAWPLVVTLLLGVTIPVGAFWLLRVLTPLGRVDRGAMAAHYGSTSLVTFTAAIVFLEASAIPFEGYVATLLTVLEIPGIIVGLLLARGLRGGGMGETLREVVFGRSVLLLVGGLAIGFLTGPVGYTRVEPFFGDLFTGVLTLFLLELGMLTGRQLSAVRQAGPHRRPSHSRRVPPTTNPGSATVTHGCHVTPPFERMCGTLASLDKHQPGRPPHFRLGPWQPPTRRIRQPPPRTSDADTPAAATHASSAHAQGPAHRNTPRPTTNRSRPTRPPKPNPAHVPGPGVSLHMSVGFGVCVTVGGCGLVFGGGLVWLLIPPHLVAGGYSVPPPCCLVG